jgi:hypothetical protein
MFILHKGKGHPRTGHESPEERVEVYLYSFFTLGARLGGWSTLRPGRFALGKNPVHVV